MPEIVCPECGDTHDVVDRSYGVAKSTGEIVIIDQNILVESDKIKDNDVESRNGPIVYCPKIGKHLAIGTSKVKMKADEISDEIIKF